MKNIIILGVILLLFSCNSPKEEEAPLINDVHLDYLIEPFEKNGKQLGAVWIYSEAPDYRYVDDDDEGYTCVDDVARAMVFYSKEYQINPSASILEKIVLLTEFLLDMQSENGYFYNFVFPDKTINTTHQNSVAEANWWSWRAFWAFSELLLIEEEEALTAIQSRAKNAMDILLPNMMLICEDPVTTKEMDGVEYPVCIDKYGTDQLALIMIGLSNYHQLYPSDENKVFLLKIGEILVSMQKGDEEAFPYFASMSWQNYWHAWGNSQAYALLKTGKELGHQPFIDAGKREVDHFYPYFLKKRVAGFKVEMRDDTLTLMEATFFPQIAYNLRPMIYATIAAYELEKDEKYADLAVRLGNWYNGDNQAGQPMYDPTTGRTFDGIISAEKINHNSGAESTIEGLLSLQSIRKHPELMARVKRE